MKYQVASLFAGVGGICLGFKNAFYKNHSYELVWANEIDPHACATYKHNFEHTLIEGDIIKIIDPDKEKCNTKRKYYLDMHEKIINQPIDILTAGFPCQAFSIAGYQKGFNDARGNLFWSITDVVKLIEARHRKPEILFLENVKNLKGHDKGRTYTVIKQQLENNGYLVKDAVINTKDLSDLPQNRERIYIIAFLNKVDATNFTMFEDIPRLYKEFGKSERIRQITEILDLDLTKNELEQFYYTKDKFPHYFLTEEEYMNINLSQRKANRINLAEEITDEYEFYQLRRGMYVRKNMNGVCPTLTANMGTGGHNVPLIKVKDGIRKLTPAEVFKLQGFPIGNGYELPTKYKGRAFPNGRLYKQAGNAVSVDVITLIATELLKALDMTAQASLRNVT